MFDWIDLFYYVYGINYLSNIYKQLVFSGQLIILVKAVLIISIIVLSMYFYGGYKIESEMFTMIVFN